MEMEDTIHEDIPEITLGQDFDEEDYDESEMMIDEDEDDDDEGEDTHELLSHFFTDSKRGRNVADAIIEVKRSLDTQTKVLVEILKRLSAKDTA